MNLSEAFANVVRLAKVKYEAGEIGFAPSPKVLRALEEKNWKLVDEIVVRPTIAGGGGYFASYASPEGKTTAGDPATRQEFHRLCREEAEKFYPKPGA